jgi:competence protein ComEC
MNEHREVTADEGYLRITAFNLNSRENSAIGEPPQLPADSFLISYYHGPEPIHILLDAGKKNQGRLVILPYLLEHNITKLNMAILSHPHQDHFGGFIDLLEHPEIEVEQILYAPVSGQDVEKGGNVDRNYDHWKQFDTIIQRNKHRCRVIKRENIGERIAIDSELIWDIIDVPHYRQDESLKKVNLNNLNLVLKLTFRQFTALFPGDSATAQTEAIFKSEIAERLKNIFLLKAAHHGGNQSLTQEMIEDCDARLVIIPANYHTVEHAAAFIPNYHLYSKNGAKVFRTDIYKTIEITTDGYSAACSAEAADYSEHIYFPCCRR